MSAKRRRRRIQRAVTVRASPKTVAKRRHRWVDRGTARTETWLNRSGGSLGPLIPHIAATAVLTGLEDRGWVPQGLAFSPEAKLLLQGYHGDKLGSALALIDEPSGELINAVYLGGPKGSVAGPVDAGGVAVIGDEVFVCREGNPPRLYRYSLAQILHAEPLSTVFTVSSLVAIAAGSYLAAAKDLIYVGSHANNRLYKYIRKNDTWQIKTPIGVRTPVGTQGVVIRDEEYVFSVSRGPAKRSKLVVQDRVTIRPRAVQWLPNLAEGVAEVDGEFVVTYQSGARRYSRGTSSRGQAWPSTHMTRTPLARLGLEPRESARPD
ncbi:hypothetical protein FB381_3666 [Nocardioides albertanoniae]|uniref:Uncharacterized protein n=2 Tax=Nocardioides albertanoniae TaxID=1175486 RepID=A0A543AAW8_9ACTN|nr:hypothetical protein FB381_3666 [Nocardioides albertanoniae]